MNQNIIMTEAGLSLLSQSIDEQFHLQFTSMQATEDIFEEEEARQLVSLPSVNQESQVRKQTRKDDKTIQVESLFSNDNLDQSHTMNTVGVFVSDPQGEEVLFSTTQLANSFLLPEAGGGPVSVLVKMNLVVDDSEVLSVNIEPGASATMSDILDMQQAEDERNLNEIERKANESERIENYQSLIEDGILRTKIDENLQNLEEEYAPKLTEVTSQLAQKVDEVILDVNSQIVKFYANGQLVNFISIAEAGNSQEVHNYIDTLVSNGKIEGVTLSDGVVTEEKTSFVDVSTNLYNPKKSLRNHVITGDLELEESPMYHLSDMIPIKIGDFISTVGMSHLIFYNTNGNPASRVGMESTGQTREVTNPDFKFFRTQFNHNVFTDDNVQINKSIEPLIYEPYYNKLKDISVDMSSIEDESITTSKIIDGSITSKTTNFVKKSTNLFNKETAIKGFRMPPDSGVPIPDELYWLSDYIDFDGEQMTQYGGGRVTFFDANDNYISSRSLDFLEPTTINKPNNVAKFRLSIRLDLLPYTQVNIGSSLLPFEPYYEDFKYKKPPKFHFDMPPRADFSTDIVFPNYEESWRNSRSSEVYALYDNLMGEHPEFITKEALDFDPTGLEIASYHFTPTRPEGDIRVVPKIFIVTGVHGHEKGSVINTYHALKLMCEDWKNAKGLEFLKHNIEIVIIPVVNPYGYNNLMRFNSNNVDINRNFPSDWVLRDPGSGTYGGTEPLSEVESLNIKKVFDENPDINIFIDYHNFQGTSSNDRFIWVPSASDSFRKISSALITKLSRKWVEDFEFLPSSYIGGYTSHLEEGTIQNFAFSEYEINLSGILETSLDWILNNDNFYSQNSIKGGVEALINFTLLLVKSLEDE